MGTEENGRCREMVVMGRRGYFFSGDAKSLFKTSLIIYLSKYNESQQKQIKINVALKGSSLVVFCGNCTIHRSSVRREILAVGTSFCGL